MPKPGYKAFEALDPFFEIVMKGLSGLVDGKHYFDTFADEAVYESRYHFPGWPVTIRGRANLMASLSGYGKSIKLHSGNGLVVHRSQDSRVVIVEYEVHGKILSSGAPYDNRFISVITIDNIKIINWRDYMDSLAAGFHVILAVAAVVRNGARREIDIVWDNRGSPSRVQELWERAWIYEVDAVFFDGLAPR